MNRDGGRVTLKAVYTDMVPCYTHIGLDEWPRPLLQPGGVARVSMCFIFIFLQWKKMWPTDG